MGEAPVREMPATELTSEEKKAALLKDVEKIIASIKTLSELNQYKDQLVKQGEEHPLLKGEMANLLENQRNFLKAKLREQVRTEIEKANLATLEGPLSPDAISLSFEGKGMTPDEARNSFELLRTGYEDRKRRLKGPVSSKGV